MKRRVRFAGWLFKRSLIARILFVLSVWPPVYVADRIRGVDPPVSWRRGWQWARYGLYEGAIPTAAEPATVRPADDIEQLMAQIIADHCAEYHPGRSCRENERGECIDRFGGVPSDNFYLDESS